MSSLATFNKGLSRGFAFQDENKKDEDDKQPTKRTTESVNPVRIKPGQALVTIHGQVNGQNQEEEHGKGKHETEEVVPTSLWSETYGQPKPGLSCFHREKTWN